MTGDSPRMAGLAGSGLAGAVDLTEASHNPAMLGFILGNDRNGQVEFSLRGISNPVIGHTIGGDRFTSSDFNGLGPWMGIGFSLPGDFAAVWENASLANRERKRMVRLLVEDVTVIKDTELTCHIRCT